MTTKEALQVLRTTYSVHHFPRLKQVRLSGWKMLSEAQAIELAEAEQVQDQITREKIFAAEMDITGRKTK